MFFSKKYINVTPKGYITLILFFSLLSIFATVIYIFDLFLTKPKQAQALTVINTPQGATDTCGRVTITPIEPFVCPSMVDATCTPKSATKVNVNSYTVHFDIKSRDGNSHTVTYKTYSNFCNNGYFVPGAGTCVCIDNEITTTKTGTVDPNGVLRATITRSSPTGQACGSYQSDFGIESIDGDPNCNFKDSYGVGAAGICQTGNTCNGAVYPTMTPTPAPYAPGNITNLNFGINNSYPWIQSVCGDIRIDNGITNKTPPGQSTLTTGTACKTPGILFIGNGTSNLGQGQASENNWIVGGGTYPEVYTLNNSGIFSSYNYLTQKAQSAGLDITNLATVCTLTNCTLPNNLKKGIYQANGDVALNPYTFGNNSNYIFLINGNLTFKGNLITPLSSTAIFSTSGNIIIPPTVGSPPTATSPNLSGIFSTDRALILPSNNNCTDLRLNVEGAIIVNAARTGSQLQNKRDLCADNGTYPTLSITQRLDFILNLPEMMKIQNTISQEVAP